MKKKKNQKRGGLSLDRNESWGDEYYTHEKIVNLVACRYKKIFDRYDYIWIPFNSEDKPMYSVMKTYYGNKIIITPDSCYSPELGFNDFFKFRQDKEFCELLNNNNVIVYDNPPFSKFTKIVRALKKSQADLIYNELKKDLDFILFADTITGLLKLRYVGGYHILSRILFLCDRTDTDDTCVNVGLFSNLFSEIKSVFFDFNTRRLHNRRIDFNEKVSRERFLLDDCLNSANLINFCQRGIVIPTEMIEKGCGKCFGGCCKISKENKMKILEMI